MDTIVLGALARWPNVPDVHHWLMLDARGRYRLRATDYASSARFDVIGNPAISEFIGRNYQSDAQGRWYFQNGPQRVFVRLAVTPWIFRCERGHPPLTHTGRLATRIEGLWIDDLARPIMLTDIGPGAVDDRDLGHIQAALTDGDGQSVGEASLERWLALPACGSLLFSWAGTRHVVQSIRQVDLAARFGFDANPAPPSAAGQA